MLNFQKIVDTISEAFSILDFSYIISGTLTFLIILLNLHIHDIHLELINNSVMICCCIFLAYIAGIFSWIVGKAIRWSIQRGIKDDFEKIYNETINALGANIDMDTFTPVSKKKDAYTYMWIELQKNENAKDRVNFIHRFWVMQAMFEGLMTSCLVAFAAVLELKYSFGEKFAWGYFVLLIALCLILFWRCMIAAKENAEVQIREIILSYYSYIKSNQNSIL